MSRSLHSTEKTETETTTTIINNKVESSVVASNNIANNNKKHASMSSSQIPVLSKVCFLKNLSLFFVASLVFLLYVFFIYRTWFYFWAVVVKKSLFKVLIVVFYLVLFSFVKTRCKEIYKQTHRKNWKCLT